MASQVRLRDWDFILGVPGVCEGCEWKRDLVSSGCRGVLWSQVGVQAVRSVGLEWRDRLGKDPRGQIRGWCGVWGKNIS